MKKIDRREFIKASGLAGAFLGSAGLGFYGYEAGKDPVTYTGAENLQGASQTFNRKRFAIDGSPHEKVGPTRRADGRSEVIFSRMGAFFRNWDEEKGLESLPPVLRKFYKENPEALELDLYLRKEIMPKFMKDRRNPEYSNQFILAEAWSHAMGAVAPEPIKDPPEVSDFPRAGRFGGRAEPLKMKSPRKTSRLIKQIAYQLGSTLVGIAKLNPDWVYSHSMGGRGFDRDRPLVIPKHWEYAIVVGTPMSWDPFYANPTYGTSNDSYSRSRIVAFRVASFIKQLGYPARPHTPGFSYDLIVPPIAIDAGLGEQGRHGVVITPELGSNFRPAVITTNLPMEVDKPIKFGVEDFCNHCKICREQCPSGAIPMGGKTVVRGYRKYQVNVSKCHNFWRSNLGNMGCRLCVAVCPYSRKSNWVHKTALDVTSNDPTGLTHKVLTFFQKIFYPGPDVQKYYMPSMGGESASYREPPWWLKTEDFIDI